MMQEQLFQFFRSFTNRHITEFIVNNRNLLSINNLPAELFVRWQVSISGLSLGLQT